MRKFGIVIALIAITFVSCTNQSKKQDTDLQDSTTLNEGIVDSHTSEMSLDWAGVYTGTMPCADCEGIETTIELKDDHTYVAHYKYLGKGDNEFTEEGTFTWSSTGSVVTLESGDNTSLYKVEENRIILLMDDGELNTGELADYYILNKKM